MGIRLKIDPLKAWVINEKHTDKQYRVAEIVQALEVSTRTFYLYLNNPDKDWPSYLAKKVEIYTNGEVKAADLMVKSLGGKHETA